MQIRITDTQMPNDELILDLDQDEAEDADDPEVDEEHVQEIIDWWAAVSNRNGEILEDHGVAVLVQIEDMQAGPMIGVWWQEMSDTTWPLSSFPFTSFVYEAVTE